MRVNYIFFAAAVLIFSAAAFGRANDLSVTLKYNETSDGRILFAINAYNINVDSWVLRIDDLNDKSVKTFSGGNVIPSTVLWDRKDSMGNDVSKEKLRVKFVVKGTEDIVAESAWILIK